jgi:hypothetical protein
VEYFTRLSRNTKENQNRKVIERDKGEERLKRERERDMHA